jgi:hypothetical protein
MLQQAEGGKYGGLMPSEVKKLRQLEAENARLCKWSRT